MGSLTENLSKSSEVGTIYLKRKNSIQITQGGIIDHYALAKLVIGTSIYFRLQPKNTGGLLALLIANFSCVTSHEEMYHFSFDPQYYTKSFVYGYCTRVFLLNLHHTGLSLLALIR